MGVYKCVEWRRFEGYTMVANALNEKEVNCKKRIRKVDTPKRKILLMIVNYTYQKVNLANLSQSPFEQRRHSVK
jgi:hypothetical protein